MHRQTPLTAGFVAYSGGGSRTLIDTIDDDKMMQEMKGTMMFGEARESIESPQNYGFSSVVLPAKKGKDGQIEECAEGFMSYMGGNRSFPICAIMDDRRHRPYNMKPGENAQYDDLGQMTLLRRAALYVLTNDNPDESQQQSSGGGSAGTLADSGGSGQNVERFVSIRHVEKKKQERRNNSSGQGQSGAGGGGGAGVGTLADGGTSGTSGGGSKDFKHEGESVNNEMRVSKKRIEFRDGDDSVVGYYDKQAKRWCFIGEIKLGSEDADHPVYGVNGGVGMTTEPSGAGAVLVKAPKPGPPTSEDMEPLALERRIAALERRIAELEGRP
jgi:phage gp45-like